MCAIGDWSPIECENYVGLSLMGQIMKEARKVARFLLGLRRDPTYPIQPDPTRHVLGGFDYVQVGCHVTSISLVWKSTIGY